MEQRSSSVATRNVPYEARGGSDDSPRKRVLVLPFLDDKVDRSRQVAETARRTLVKELAETGHLVIVRHEDIAQNLSQYLNENKDYDLDKLAPLAASMGIAAVIEGKILEIHAKKIGDDVGVFRKIRARIETTVRLRVIAARNGKLILEDTKTGLVEADTTQVGTYSFSDRHLQDDPNLIQLSVARAFRGGLLPIFRAVEKLNWEGRVAMVSGERIYVNAGRLSGLQIGDILKVSEEGDEVFDPETGTYIGRAPGRMKGTLEIVSYFGKDGTIAIIHSGSGFLENDRVMLY